MISILQADARQITLHDQTVQCVVTSPPYWQQRSYKGGEREIGQEVHCNLFVEAIIQVFGEIRRVLRDDGTVWLNLGDTAMKSIPWRVAIALQDRGWILRSDIVWAKSYSFHPSTAGSCMPESVKNRPTRSHEYIFLLTKSEKYFYDHVAVKENGIYPAGTKAAKGSGKRQGNRRKAEYAVYSGKRNLRSVWCINPKPYKEAHFSTFPPALVEPCIKAGSRTGDLVLDPFGGSGTTAFVAGQLGRSCVSLDLNPDYLQLQRKRLGLFL